MEEALNVHSDIHESTLDEAVWVTESARTWWFVSIRVDRSNISKRPIIFV